jgi:hypothetical protein
MTKKTTSSKAIDIFSLLDIPRTELIPEATIVGKKPTNIDIPEVSIIGKRMNKEKFIPVRPLQQLRDEFGDFPTDPKVKIEMRNARYGKTLMEADYSNSGAGSVQYAFGTSGSQPNAVLEGGEVLETPNGQSSKIEGPSHEQGGVKTNIPQGTEIYSDRLKIGDKTLAERKEIRDKRLVKIMDAFEKDGSNVFVKNALNRTKEGNDFQDAKDLAFQEQAKQMIQHTAYQAAEEFALGVTSFNNPYAKFGFTKPEAEVTGNVLKTAEDTGMGFTTGDIIGTAGMAIGSISQMFNTIENAKATKPVVNHYAGFNEKALQANAEATDQIGYNKNVAETEAERNLTVAENTARARTRNSASSMNTMRSLDLATDISSNEAKVSSRNQLESVFGQQRLQTLGQKTQLLSEKDREEMAGQTAADEANAANLDNFYTNFGQNLAGMTNTIENLGKNMNDAKHRNDVLNIMKDANPWGVGYQYKNGKLDMTAEKVPESKYTPPVKTITENATANPFMVDWNNSKLYI